MEKKGILKETYKSYVYENQNIFDLSFDMLIKLIFDKYPDLLNDTILISYLYDNISNFIDINDSYKIKLLSNSLFLKKCKGKDIVNILLTINNDEDKIKILLNENIYPRIFNNHFLVFDTLKINFNNDENYIKLLNKLPSKAKIIVLYFFIRFISNLLLSADYIPSALPRTALLLHAALSQFRCSRQFRFHSKMPHLPLPSPKRWYNL